MKESAKRRLSENERGSLTNMLNRARAAAHAQQASQAVQSLTQLPTDSGSDDEKTALVVPATPASAVPPASVAQPAPPAATLAALAVPTAPPAATPASAVTSAIDVDEMANYEPPTKVQKRDFREEWTKQWSWVRVETHGGVKGMLCVACDWYYVGEKKGTLPANVRGGFTRQRPVNNYKNATDALKGHEKSGHHITAIKAHAVAEAKEGARAQKEQLDIAQQLAVANDLVAVKNLEGLKKLVRCLHFNARRMHAVEELPELLDHEAYEVGCVDIRRHIEGKCTYTSPGEVRSLLECVGAVVLEDIVCAIKKSPYWSFMADESKDSNKISECGFCVRFLDGADVREVFITLVELDGGTAQHYTEKLLPVVTLLGLDPRKMVAVGLDGTNTMSGSYRGLQARLRVHLNAHAIYFWCTIHQFVLRPTACAKRRPALYVAITLTKSLWVFFNATPKRVSDWEKFQLAAGVAQDDIRRILEPHDIRWVRNAQCLGNITVHYALLRDFLAEKESPLADKLKEESVVAAAFFMATIESLTAALVTKLQDPSMTVFEIPGVFDVYLSDLTELEQNPLGTAGVYTEWNSVYEHVATEDVPFMPFHENTAAPHIRELIAETKEVIANVPFLQHFAVFLPQNFPTDSSALLGYGVSALDQLLQFYCSPAEAFYYASPGSTPLRDEDKVVGTSPPLDFDRVRITAEYTVYKDMFISMKESKPTMQEIYKLMLDQNLFTHLRKLIGLFLCIPVANATCERVVSAMNDIKTKRRQTMKNAQLNANMRIALSSRNRGRVVSKTQVRDKVLSDNQVFRIIKRFYSMKNNQGDTIMRMLRIPANVLTTGYPLGE